MGSYKGNLGLQWRLQHNPDGSFQFRDDQDEYEKLNETLDVRPHTIKGNAVWALPKVPQSFGNVAGAILNDWRWPACGPPGQARPTTSTTATTPTAAT